MVFIWFNDTISNFVKISNWFAWHICTVCRFPRSKNIKLFIFWIKVTKTWCCLLKQPCVLLCKASDLDFTLFCFFFLSVSLLLFHCFFPEIGSFYLDEIVVGNFWVHCLLSSSFFFFLPSSIIQILTFVLCQVIFLVLSLLTSKLLYRELYIIYLLTWLIISIARV